MVNSTSIKALQESEVPQSIYTPLDNILKSKFSTDFIPGRATEVQACRSKAISTINDIIVSSKRMKENNILKDIASQLNSKLKTDRSSMNYNKYDYIFANLPHFEKEFKLRKYEIEDLYLKRQGMLQEEAQ